MFVDVPVQADGDVHGLTVRNLRHLSDLPQRDRGRATCCHRQYPGRPPRRLHRATIPASERRAPRATDGFPGERGEPEAASRVPRWFGTRQVVTHGARSRCTVGRVRESTRSGSARRQLEVSGVGGRSLPDARGELRLTPCRCDAAPLPRQLATPDQRHDACTRSRPGRELKVRGRGWPTAQATRGIAAGAVVVGGCCRVRPGDIADITDVAQTAARPS
jgi:hypothetical protein